MTKAEAMRILDPESRPEALEPYRLDCGLMKSKVEEACRVAAEAMQESEQLQNQLILRNDELLKLRDHAPKWVSVEERPPEKNGEYIVHIRWAETSTVLTYRGVRKNGEQLWCDNDINYYNVTHWMPMPEPPEVDV